MPDTVRSVSRRRQGEAEVPEVGTGEAPVPGRQARYRLGHALAVMALVLCALPLLLASALALRLCAGPIDVTGLARRLAAPTAEQAGAMHGLALGRVRLAWRDGEVGVLLDDVSLAGGSHAGHVGLAVRPWPLLRRHVVLLQAEADGLELRLWRDRDGHVGLRPGASPGRPSDRPLDLDAVRSVHVEHSSVVLHDAASGQTCRVAIAALDLAPLRRPAAVGAAGRLDASLSCGGAGLRLQGGGREVPDGSIAWHVETDPVVPADLVPPALAASVPALASLDDLRLPVALALDTVLTGGYGAYMVPRAVQVALRLGAGRVLLPGAKPDILPVASGLVGLTLALPDDGDGPLQVVLTPSRLALAGPDAPDFLLSGQGRFRGQAIRFGVVAESPRIGFAGLAAYWPSLLAGGARTWVTANITRGTASNFRLDIDMASTTGADGLRLDRLQGGLDADAMELHWLRPVPPLRALDGHLVFDGPDALHITARHGVQEVPRHAPLTTGASLIRITGLSAPRQEARIETGLSGGLPDLLALLAHPRLRLLSQHPLPFTDPAGRFAGRLTLDLPLVDTISAAELRVHAGADLTGVHLGDVAVGRDIDQASVTLEATQDGLSAHGSGLIGGMPSAMSYSTDFRAGPPDQNTETAHVTSHVTDAAVQQEGLDEAHRFTGEALLDVGYEHRRSGAARVALALDLAQAGLDTPLWRKHPGTPASATGVFGLQDQHLVSIESLHASGEGIALDGRAEVEGGHARTVVIDRFVLGRSRGSGRIVLPSRPVQAGSPRREASPLRLSLHGPVLDVLPYLSEAAPARSKAQPGAPAGPPGSPKPVPDAPWQADLAFRKVLFSPTRAFGDVTLHAEARGSVLSTVRLRIAGPTPVDATMRPERQQAGRAVRRLRVQADDTGALLRALGVVDTIEGGVLILNGTLEPASGRTQLRAVADIGRFIVHDAPLAARLARDLSVYGFLTGSQSKQLVITKFEAPFVLDGDTLLLTGAHASNAALGATLRGPIHLAAETFDLKGTIVPSYLFNALPGKLPGVGAVFSPEKGGGLLAATLTLTGPIDRPHLRVNPLALLAPGILRRLLFH